MINGISLRNFRILREVDVVKLRPFTLLVGPNASGKSTLLEALDLLFRVLATLDWAQISASFQHADILSRKANGPLEIYVSGRHGNENYLLEWSNNRIREIRGSEEELRVTAEGVMQGTKLGFKRRVLRLALDPQALAAPSYPKDVDLTLPPDGAGLSSILAGLQLEFPDRYQSLIDQLKTVVPDVRGVRIKRVALEGGVSFELRFDMKAGEDIPASAISWGTLLALGLLTSLICQDMPPHLVLIDELERRLHPKALGHLIRQLRRLQEQNPKLQIIATSHSPYLLDHFKAEEILLSSLNEEGYAVIKPLTDHPEYERWKNLMAPGEFWSTVGESWITQQDPKKVRS